MNRQIHCKICVVWKNHEDDVRQECEVCVRSTMVEKDSHEEKSDQ